LLRWRRSLKKPYKRHRPTENEALKDYSPDEGDFVLVEHAPYMSGERGAVIASIAKAYGATVYDDVQALIEASERTPHERIREWLDKNGEMEIFDSRYGLRTHWTNNPLIIADQLNAMRVLPFPVTPRMVIEARQSDK
jgi:hypothetical protein